jgi:hypothetical protein
MKSAFVLSMLFCFLFCKGYSQTDSIPKHYELKGLAYKQADSIQDVWMTTHYPVVLKKNKLKMTCAHCSNIFMDVIFKIRADGRAQDWLTVNSNKCGEKFSAKLEEDFLIFFENFIFPPSLRNLIFEWRLGTGLSC